MYVCPEDDNIITRHIKNTDIESTSFISHLSLHVGFNNVNCKCPNLLVQSLKSPLNSNTATYTS